MAIQPTELKGTTVSDQFKEQHTVGDGQDEQPGADGAPLDEDYDYDPPIGEDDPDEEDEAE